MKLLNSIACVTAGLLFVACSKNTTDGPDINVTNPAAKANISITIDGSDLTRAVAPDEPGTAAENKINQLEFYVFDASGTADAERPYLKVDNYDGSKVTFAVTAGVDKKILVAANMNLGAITTTDTYEVVRKKFYEDNPLIATTSRTAPTYFAMSGEVKATVEEDVPDNPVTIKVSRLISKVFAPTLAQDFAVQLSDEQVKSVFGATATGTPTFTLKGYALVNGLDVSDAFSYWNTNNNEAEEWSLWRRKAHSIPAFAIDGTGDLVGAYSGEETAASDNFWLSGTTGVSNVVFVYENTPEVDADYERDYGIRGFTKSSIYSFLIKGDFTLGSDTETRYWKIYLIYDDEYKVFRNTIYRVTITNITSEGYKTAEEAYEDANSGTVIPGQEQTGILATITVADWRVRTQTTDI